MTTINTKSLPLVQTGQGDSTRRFTPKIPTSTPASSKQIDLSFLIEEDEAEYYSKAISPYLTSDLIRLFHIYPIDFYSYWIRSEGRRLSGDENQVKQVFDYLKCQSHIHANRLLSQGVEKGVIRLKVGEFVCQGRIDWFNPDPDCGIIELTTTPLLKHFESHILQKYIHRLAFHRNLVFRATGHKVATHIIVAEPGIDNYKCGVWKISDSALDIAQADNEAAIKSIAQCKKYNSWPTGYEDVRIFDYPHRDVGAMGL